MEEAMENPEQARLPTAYSAAFRKKAAG